MKLIRIIFALSLLILSYQSFSQELPVGKYSDAAISNGFKRSIVVSFSGDFQDDSGNQTVVLISGETKPGVLARFKGKSLLRVVENINISIGDVNVKNQEISYVDPVSLKEVYSFSPEEGELKTYEYVRNYPASMNVGDVIELNKGITVSEKNPKKIISKFKTSLSLAPLEGKEGLFEFCENEATYNNEDDFQEISGSTSACIIMNQEGKNFGAFMDLVVGGVNMHLTGTIQPK